MNLAVSSSTFSLITTSALGTFLYYDGDATGTLTSAVIASTFECFSSDVFTSASQTDIYTKLATPTSDIGGLFYHTANSAGTHTVTSASKFRNCWTASNGGVFYLPAAMTLSDTSSQYSDLASTNGGVAYCNGCTMNIVSSTFSDTFANKGSVFYVDNGATVSLTSVAMSNGRAWVDGGAMYFADSSGGSPAATLTFATCASTLQYYEAHTHGGFIASYNKGLKITSSNCNWDHIFAWNSGGLIYGGKLNEYDLSSCTIQNITARTDGAVFYSTDMTKFSLASCTIDCKQTWDSATVLAKVPTLSGDTGTAFYITGSATPTITSTDNTFKNCYTSTKAAIFTVISATMTESGSSYTQNGGVYGSIYCETCTLTVQKSGSVTPKFNTVHGSYGGAIYVKDSSTVTLNDLEVTTASAVNGGVLYFTETTTGSATSTLAMTGGSWTSVSTLSGSGGGIYADV